MDKIYGQLDIATIEKLAEIVAKGELSELTIESGDNKITVKGKKPVSDPVSAYSFSVMPDAQTLALNQNAAARTASPAQSNETAVVSPISGNVVKSPIVGTFYAAPSPDKAPFVRIGDSVKKGDVIMIIESMKLMNEVQSEFDGVVKEILVSDGQAVEFDQPIMIIG